MSSRFGVRHALCWTGGELVSGPADAVFDGTGIDTRTLGRGDLFVAIRGTNHDAHGFIGDALERGASGVLVNRGAETQPALDAIPDDVAVIAVDDTTAALGSLATGHRCRFRGPVVGITGSNGKTTTKEMTAAILSERSPCLKTEGNLNNEFGVPLTLLRREDEHETAVVEMGMNHRGEIARLARIARPTIAVITNIGTAHIGQLGSREEIAREKGDIYGGLAADGVAIVNGDDPRVMAQSERAPGRTVRFGHDPAADVRAEGVRFLDRGAFVFELITPIGRREVEVPGLAETAVVNALAASAAALEAGASLDDVVAGLAGYQNVRGRMDRRQLPEQVVVIDDSYNANPQSMRAALESLSQLKGGGRSFAVLGDMGELGEDAAAAHRDVGRWAAELGVDFLFTVGELAGEMAAGAAEAGMPSERIRACDRIGEDGDAPGREVCDLIGPRDWVLVKGSRSMPMERIADWVEHHLSTRDGQGAH